MRKLLIAAPLVLLLGGCANFADDVLGIEDPLALLGDVVEKGRKVEDATFDAAASAVDEYCDNAPVELRMYLRDGVNSRTERGDVIIVCDGD